MSLVKLVCRPMVTSDLPWVTTVEAELHPHPWSQGNFADSMSAGHGCWVFCEGPEACAYAVLMVVLDEAHLLNISVRRCDQGRGMGAALLQFLFDEARRHGAQQMFLEVRESNAVALKLYRGRGFEAIGRRKGYYRADPGREDAIVMRHAL